MSVAEEAAQLNAVANQIESEGIGTVMAADSVMDAFQGQVNQILQGTASNTELMGLFEQNKELRHQAAAHMREIALRLTATGERIMGAGA